MISKSFHFRQVWLIAVFAFKFCADKKVTKSENLSQSLKSACNPSTIKILKQIYSTILKDSRTQRFLKNDRTLEVAFTYMYVVWPAQSVEGFLLRIPYHTVIIIMSLGVWIIWHSLNTTILDNNYHLFMQLFSFKCKI